MVIYAQHNRQRKELIKIEEWISLNEFMRRRKIGYNVALQMIANNEVLYQKTGGGRYKIKVGGESVSTELYNKLLERATKAETKLKILEEIILEGRNKR